MSNSHITFTVTLDGKDITSHIPFPIKWERLLDERLDVTRLSIKRIKRHIIHPLTPVSITMTDTHDRKITLNAIVTTDESVEAPAGSGLYNHEIFMLEETKLLEGIVVDALTFTNDLGRNYTENVVFVTPTENDAGGGVKNSAPDPDEYKMAVQSGEFVVKSIADVFSTNFLDISLKAHPGDPNEPNKVGFITTLKLQGDSEYIINEVHDEYDYEHPMDYSAFASYPTVLSVGTYELTYRIYRPRDFQFYTEYTYEFNVVENHDPLPLWNIATVIDRVLDVAEPHLEGVTPRFALNAEQHAAFEKIEAPEFTFTNSTLKEILDQIGGYIHGVPRLRGNTIYYDMLDGVEQATLANPKYAYISNAYTQDVESYCTGLDSTVDNMVCLTDPAQGTITDPYNDGYKTVRTETVYARVEEGNMFIATQLPIQELKGVKCGIVPTKNFAGGDITAYIFESAEYNRMSGYTATYPNSKAYALYYTQGTKNIYGLNFKIEDAVSPALQKYAIINILEKTSGQTIGNLGNSYQLLAFQVSYIPIFRARTQQTKSYIGDLKQPRTLCYNQGANVVETRYYGENMKGAVARMGNVDRVVTYNLGAFSLIPEIGQMYGEDYYVSGVACELTPGFVKCMVTLSQDFNRLSQYIGINSVRRFYEVSEKAAYKRDMKYADYIVVGDQVESDETLANMLPVMATFTQDIEYPAVSHMIARGHSENGTDIGSRVLLPVISTAQGSAMVLTANYEDNYSAGTQVQQVSAGDAKGYFTNAVEYSDYYGRIHNLEFAMYNRLPSIDQNTRGKSLPAWGADWNGGNRVLGTEEHNLVVRKDGSEILALNYILEYVTNRKHIVIGSALAHNCPLVRGIDKTRKAKLYILPKRIGKFVNVVDLSNATEVTYAWPSATAAKQFKLSDFTPEVNGAAWAIVDGSTNELLLGSNETITAGQVVSMPYMTIKHNIFNL